MFRNFSSFINELNKIVNSKSHLLALLPMYLWASVDAKLTMNWHFWPLITHFIGLKCRFIPNFRWQKVISKSTRSITIFKSVVYRCILYALIFICMNLNFHFVLKRTIKSRQIGKLSVYYYSSETTRIISRIAIYSEKKR